MAQTPFKLVIDGFVENETDFAPVLARNPQHRVDMENLVAVLVEAEVDPSSGVYWSVTIAGHADVVSSGSAEERRARELAASRARCESAALWLLAELSRGVTAAGHAPITSDSDPKTVGLMYVHQGAADLVHPVPANETQRRQNRRVKLLIVNFTPDEVVFADRARAALGEYAVTNDRR